MVAFCNALTIVLSGVMVLIGLCLCNHLTDETYKVQKLSKKDVSPIHVWPPPTDAMTIKNCGPPASCSINPWPVTRRPTTVQCNVTAAHTLLDGTISAYFNKWPYHVEYNFCAYTNQKQVSLCPVKKGETVSGTVTGVLNIPDMYFDHTEGNFTITNSNDDILVCLSYSVNRLKSKNIL